MDSKTEKQLTVDVKTPPNLQRHLSTMPEEPLSPDIKMDEKQFKSVHQEIIDSKRQIVLVCDTSLGSSEMKILNRFFTMVVYDFAHDGMKRLVDLPRVQIFVVIAPTGLKWLETNMEDLKANGAIIIYHRTRPNIKARNIHRLQADYKIRSIPTAADSATDFLRQLLVHRLPKYRGCVELVFDCLTGNDANFDTVADDQKN